MIYHFPALLYFLLVSNPAFSTALDLSVKETASSANLQITQSISCPAMPRIKSAIVFQSVSAPQIEPMNEQEFQTDPNNPDFKSYDLVMDKPAGILIQLEENFRSQMEMDNEFRIALYIGKADNQVYANSCFHDRLYDVMRREDIEYCSFTGNSLESRGYYKFFPLPMFSLSFDSFLIQGNTDIPVRLALSYRYNERCQTEKTFKINLIKTHNLKLGFTRIDGGGSCYASGNINTGYDITPFDKVRDFANSDEVFYQIERMFPIVRANSYAVRYSWNKRSYDFIQGNCNNRKVVERPTRTVGLLSDIAMLEYIRASLEYDKLMAVVPESYFVFHRGKDHDSAGFFIQPRWRGRFLWWKHGFLGGSWNVAIVHEEQEDKGTVSHELAHILGQGREFYKPHEMCRQYRGSALKACNTYKIQRALLAGDQFWRLLKDRFSIVNNKGNDIEDIWIDRDTYQKTFQTLSRRTVIPRDEEFLGKSIVASDYYREKESSLKAVISGFYSENEEDFIAPSIRIEKTKLLTPSFTPKDTELTVMTFELKEGDVLLQQIKRPMLEMSIGAVYKGDISKEELFEVSPAMVIFKLPENSKERNLWIYALNPKNQVIYSAPVPTREGGNSLKEEMANLVDELKDTGL